MVLSPCAQSTHLSSSNSSSSPHPLPSDRRSRSIAGALAVPPTGQRHRSSRNPGPCWDGSFRRRSMHHTASQTASFNSPDHFVRQPGCYVQLADSTLQPRGFFEHPGLASHHDKLVSISPDQFSGIAEAVAVATYRSLSDDTRVSPLQQRDDMRTPENIPVFVMLPLDTVNAEGVFRYAGIPWFSQALQLLTASGVHGVAVDVWWSAVEKAPRSYNWAGYKQLFEMLRSSGLKVQVVLSFHACGGNVGDLAEVPLPAWVLEAGRQDPDIFFTDRPRHNGLGQRNKEYISIFADDAPVLAGRTPLQCYEDFMVAFRDACAAELRSGLIEEVVVGMGPCGELRYPAYVEANGWRFPGVGEFQCYDRRALASLAQAAAEVGHPEWGYAGPHDSGTYNSRPYETGFFAPGGSYESAYGHFFLSWYSSSLLQHGEKLADMARRVFGPYTTRSSCSSGISSPLAQAQAVLRRIQSLISSSGGTAAMAAAAVAAAAAVLGVPASGSLLDLDVGSGDTSGADSPCTTATAMSTGTVCGEADPAAAAAAAAGAAATPAAGGLVGRGGPVVATAAVAVAAPAGAGQGPGGAGAPGTTGKQARQFGPRSNSGSNSSNGGLLRQLQSSCGSLPAAASIANLTVLLSGAMGAPPAQQQQQQQSMHVLHNVDSWDSHVSCGGVDAVLAGTAPASAAAAAGGAQVDPAAGRGGPQQAALAAAAPGGHAMRMDLSEPNLPGILSGAASAGDASPDMQPGAAAGVHPQQGGGLGALQGLLQLHATSAPAGEHMEAGAAAAAATGGAAQGWDSSTASVASDTQLAADPAAAEEGPWAAAAAAAAHAAAAAAAGSKEDGSGSLAAHLLVVLKDALAGLGEGALSLLSAPRAAAPGHLHHHQHHHQQHHPQQQQEAQPLHRTSQTRSSPLVVTMKIAGVHWWYRHSSHASELTAGYYNTDTRDGYQPVLELCARHGLNLTLTCVEMCDAQHPQHAQCGPEGLLRQIRAHAALLDVSLSGENALPIFQMGGVDTTAMDRIVSNTRACSNAGLRTCTSWPGTGPSAGHLLGNIVSTGRTFSEVGRLLLPVREGSCSSLSNSGSGSSLGEPGMQGQAMGPGRWFVPDSSRVAGSRLSPHHHNPPLHHQHQQHEQQHQQQAAGHHGHLPPHQAAGQPPAVLPPMRSFTFLRLGPEFLQSDHQVPWMRFMYKMLNERS